jgi:hypothetical protein
MTLPKQRLYSREQAEYLQAELAFNLVEDQGI